MKHSFFLVLLTISLVGCQKTVPRHPINPKPATTIFQENILTSKKIMSRQNEIILDYIARDSVNTYVDSQSGFWYTYITKINKDATTPKMGDIVTFEYDIADIEGNVIYDKESLGEKTYTVDKEDFITAIQKGIKIMKKGEVVTFIIPSYSAFGIAGDGNKIGVNTIIKSTVKLINIK
ncbi:gliding motility-associated peptidyl-prolyl isomerase GldI [Polaribacter tangerinus]|uniref:gliding motility-associated peptidyl-prolyl isomerase GldI n=1 Tax=Polaribacter tangerinus TaxID=1920034 RepID=UPI000B4AA947|nr:gliding motility-associated peptidyl-prolyl isomerase GldI [Polaribacter tangerinus]